MTLEEKCSLSYYREVAGLDRAGKIVLVQHQEDGQVFVKKVLDVFDCNVYVYLKAHPVDNTPLIYEAVKDGDHLIVIEEYLSGLTLSQLISRGCSFSENVAADIALQLCTILRKLHSANPPIVHRDIKPSNIIISPHGIVKLLDMDAAKQVHGGSSGSDTRLIGTAGYAAPEQYGFLSSDPRTDIYAMGVLLNKLLTGALPNEKKHRGRLGGIITKCTMLDPGMRYQTVIELESALAEFCSSVGSYPMGDTCGYGYTHEAQSEYGHMSAHGAGHGSGHKLVHGSSHRYSYACTYIRSYIRAYCDARARFRADMEIRRNKLHSPLPPGFRSRNPLHMLTGALGYLFLFRISLASGSVRPADTAGIFQAGIFILGLLMIFFTFNYMGVQRLFKFTRTEDPGLKFWGIVLGNIFIFIIVACVISALTGSANG